MSDRKRLITDLRVIDLRAELEKRNLDKSGVRGVLIQRLSKYLEDEGHDPATYRFDLSAESKGTPAKRTRRSGSTAEAEGEETPTIEGMIVQDDAGEDDEPETSQQTTTPDAVTTVASDTEADAATATAAAATNRKREHQKEPEEIEPKKPCLEKIEVEIKLENNCDTEDSINLDIGDDELLNEETDTAIKIKKDVDAGNEDSSEAACNEAAPDGSAATFDSTTGDQQVNAEAAATSNDDEKPDIDQKDGEKKDKKDEGKEGGARNLWVSGLSGDTRAKDLKQLCSKHGKVIGAKVVTNARTPGSRCYGYVTMASSHDAENCIKNLHRTELHGRMISVEKAKSESAKSESESALRRQPWRSDRRSSKDHKEDPKESDDTRDEKKDFKKESGEGSRSASRSREKSHRSDKERPRRSTRSRERRREALSFSKVWQKERDVQRARERSRMVAREAERRRREVEESLRERERRQRQEKHRLALEREKLRAEREKIEREKNELLRLERERHRLEREKLELERLELKRAQLRLEEERRKRGYESSSYRKPAASPPPPEPAYDRERHKRAPPPPLTSNRAQFEAPPPPRFEMTSSYDRGTEKRDRDYKRDYPRHVSSGNMKYPSNGNANEETRQPMPPGTRPKEPSRYDARDSRSYRPSPPGKPEPRSWNASSRYPDSAPASKGGSGSGEPWAGAEARYGGTYEARYQPAYQPPPPGAPYPDRYAPARDYRKY